MEGSGLLVLLSQSWAREKELIGAGNVDRAGLVTNGSLEKGNAWNLLAGVHFPTLVCEAATPPRSKDITAGQDFLPSNESPCLSATRGPIKQSSCS